MQRRSSQLQSSSLIVFFSIITIIVQFITYYFFVSPYLILGISCFISILFCIILIEQTSSYEAGLIYSILTLFVTSIITFLTYFSKEKSLIPYTDFLLLMLLIPWFIPTLTSIVRNMFDHRTRLTGFQDFFRNNSILFLLFYFTAILIGSFSPHTFSWVNQLSISAANFTPFMGLATQIEDFIYQENTLFDILSYLVVRIAVFLPYGFYCTLLLRKQSRLLRLLVLLLFPAILEIIQYFFYIERCDIDDVIYALFGGILGAGSYHLFHTIFRFVSGKEFLERETDYGFANSKIHF